MIVNGVVPLAFVGCVDCLAANNTIIDPEHWLVRILQETTSADGYEFEPARRGRFVNNLVYYARAAISGKDVNVGPNTEPDSFTFENNLWYAHDDPGSSAPTLPVAESGGISGQDPGLDDQYRIAAGSPAAGAGLAVAGIRSDAAGACYADPPSIGAYEVP